MDEEELFDFVFNREKLETKGVKSGSENVGIGFVIIPKLVDVKTFIQDALGRGRISINGGYGFGDFHDVPVDREVLQRIVFPKKSGEYGSPVVWLKVPKHESPIVISCLKYDDDFYEIKKNGKRITRNSDSGNLADIDIDPESSRITINLLSKDDNIDPEIIIKTKSKEGNERGRIVLQTGKEFIVESDGRIVNIAEDTLEMATVGKDGRVNSRLILNSKKDSDEQKVDRFLFQDDNENEIRANSERIQIKAPKSKRIVFGEDGDNTEPLIKGNKLVDTLKDLIDAINKITVPTAFGPSGTPNNAVEFESIKNNLDSILSKISNTE